ncbi:MAG: FKBP-type peptidyl-prolyl cis-trans isomerase [Faecalibacterium prausnitzii]
MLPLSWCPTRARPSRATSVHIDYEGLLDGKPLPGRHRTEPGPPAGQRPHGSPAFEDGILGHKGGEEFEINVTFPVRYHVKDLAGKPVVFKIKLIDVCVRQLPCSEQRLCQEGKPRWTPWKRSRAAGASEQLHDGKHAGALNRAKDQVLTPAGRCR